MFLPTKKIQPYCYRKSSPIIPSESKPRVKTKRGRISQLLPGVLITLGSIMIANVAWPIVSYQLVTAPRIRKTELISPINQTHLANKADVLKSDMQTPQVLGADLDYTNAKNWFPSAQFSGNLEQPKDYKLTIPAVDITNAEVMIGGESLDRSLVQYPGTASPGQLGSPVIFGHSILRQFYNPSESNPNRYMSIFSKIMTLKPGEEIFIDYDGIRYTYEVKDKVEVKPEDIFILEQRYNNRELKLITCVPEGTYLRRGVVIAQLVDLEK